MVKLIHEKDLQLYSKFVEGTNIHNPIQRATLFYQWAKAKGYQTHEQQLKKQNNKNKQQKLEAYL